MSILSFETPFIKVDLIRTVTLPYLEPFGISNGLELKVSHCLRIYDLRPLYCVNEDKKARVSSPRRRRGLVSMSHSEASQNSQLCRTWKSQTHTRYRVRLNSSLYIYALYNLLLQTRSPREPSIFQSHDRGGSFGAKPLHT